MDENQLELADVLMNSIIEGGIKRARVVQKRPEDFEGVCSCGTDIPSQRIDAGYYNCVFCQEQIESRNKYFRGP